MKRQFTIKERLVLTEIYRRLNYFKNGDLTSKFLLLQTPSAARRIVNLGLIQSSFGVEIERVYCWYCLTEKGKDFFQNYIERISEADNSLYFDGIKIKNFNPELL